MGYEVRGVREKKNQIIQMVSKHYEQDILRRKEI
jgi:hypothetical protein